MNGSLESGRLGNVTPLLEIETLGAEGLRYRLRGRSSSHGLQLMGAYDVCDLRDTVGAGDWCTAGIVHALGARGAVGLTSVNKEEVESALRLGQAFGALACGYEGARGGMYDLDKKQFFAAIKRIIRGSSPRCRGELPNANLLKIWKAVCPACLRGGQTNSGNE